MTGYKEYLESIWYDVKNPVSYFGPLTLYRYVKQQGQYKINLNKVKQWLNDQDT